MRVPAHLQEVKEALALRSWVESKAFPRESYFETIDLCKERLGHHQPEDEDDEPSKDAIPPMLAAALDYEGRLLTYVLAQETMAIEDEARWGNICLAAGWVVLQLYEKACRNGEWPPDD